MLSRKTLLIIALLSAPILYKTAINWNFERLCRNHIKVAIDNREEFSRFINFIFRTQRNRTQKMWVDELSLGGYSVEDSARRYGWGAGNTEYYILVRHNGRIIAHIYNLVVNLPNYSTIIGADGPQIDRNCAYGHMEYYPPFWQVLHGR